MKEVKRDIEGKTDIKFFVDQFYGKVRQNDLLAPVFASRILDGNWAEHLERMYDFWNAILFSKTGFQGNPMQKHLSLPIEEKHFTQWLALFRETIDESFKGPKAEEAKKRATSIAQIMNFKIASLRI
ncbi:MAG TPA: group III truncated hemoglobin [Flavisolibacter sp.]